MRRLLVRRGLSRALVCGTILLGINPAHAAGEARPVADRLGVAHVGGKYHLTSQDFLNEGAQQIQTLGSRVIKVWFKGSPEQVYPFNSQWPAVGSLVDLAKTPYYRALFDRPFTTFILETYAFGRSDQYWQTAISDADMADESRQFEALTRHLLATYAGSGKTFVLQNWEGDWAIRPNTDPKLLPTPTAIGGMIRWLNARQDGVDRARAAVPGRGVQVFHAAEVNLVLDAMQGKPGVVNDVLPRTHCDLYSYSAHENSPDGTRFRASLDYLAARAPDSPSFGAKNIYIGEFGVPENTHGTAAAVACVQRTIAEALDWGCPYFIFWEIYDNECRDGHCPGLWLIKPSGEKSQLWYVLQSFLGPPSRPQFADSRSIPPPGSAPGMLFREALRPAFPAQPPPPQPGMSYREALRPAFPGAPSGGTPPPPPPQPQPELPASAGAPQVLPLADGLIGQVNTFIEQFAATAQVVPEGKDFLADAQALGDAAAQFRRDAASGVVPARLSGELRAVEELWLRMSRRTERVAQGRMGPHIEQVALMGQALRQLRLAYP